LATVAVAVAAPLALNTGESAPARPAATGQDRAVVAPVTVPDVVDRPVTEAVKTLREAGLVVDDPDAVVVSGTVRRQEPAAGKEVAAGERITLTVEPSPTMPQDLGDLGDGRTFGGIHIGYLPEGLEWSRWSGKDGFGKKSYTTSFAPGGDEKDGYGVQVVVFEGAASKVVERRIGVFTAVEVNGRKGYLANVTEGGSEASEPGNGATLTIGWFPRDGLAVEVYISPHYAKQVDAEAEIKKVAEGIKLAGR
ncbi:PASTA domain-containing protein, partial [Nonomuraea lactucae]|uniref:PASTA domain-containing protein n=1 Tax=Nonomuraea lactucae TaxID=2249762 RepID=UPI000DE1DDCC